MTNPIDTIKPETPVAAKPAKPSNPIAELRQQFAAMQPELALALPAHVPAERFVRIVMTAVQKNPDLLQADRKSLFAACMQCAQDGLLPDGRDAALVVGNSKDKKTQSWVKMVQYRTMIGGVLKKARQSGEIKSISVDTVREGDRFRHYKDEAGEHFEHESLTDNDSDAPILWVYAAVWLKDGGFYFRKMSKARIEQARAVSRAKDDGPWKEWWEEMAHKTVLRNLSKLLPMSSEIDSMLRQEDQDVDFSRGSPPKVLQSQSPLAAMIAGRAAPAAVPELTYDGETGEILNDIEGETNV